MANTRVCLHNGDIDRDTLAENQWGRTSSKANSQWTVRGDTDERPEITHHPDPTRRRWADPLRYRTCRPYTVRALSKHFVVCTRPRDFTTGEFVYSVIDWRNGIRGPINVIGHGADVSTEERCRDLLADLEAAGGRSATETASNSTSSTDTIGRRVFPVLSVP
ncbi:hypothetical protein JVH1_41855 [Rhodococcus sp. JVH1]